MLFSVELEDRRNLSLFSPQQDEKKQTVLSASTDSASAGSAPLEDGRIWLQTGRKPRNAALETRSTDPQGKICRYFFRETHK